MEKEVLGKCPLCETGDIIGEDSLFKCSNSSDNYNEETEKWENEGCQYKIFRGALSRFGKNEISNDEVKALLSNGSVLVKINNRNKTELIDVNLVIDEKWGVQVQFEKSEPVERKNVGICPICKEHQIEVHDKLYKCAGGNSKQLDDGTWKNEGCQYKIFRSAFQKFGKQDIIDSEVKELLENDVVEVTILNKRDKSPQKVKALIDEKWGIKLDFNKG